MKSQLLSAWKIHHEKNRFLLTHISSEGMIKSLSARGGRNIGQQWTHIHNVRLQWLEVCAPDLFKKLSKLDPKASPGKETILRALDESAEGIRVLLERGWNNGGVVKGFKKGILPLLGYFISHESHHRGNMLLTLKQTGEKIPDAVKWGLWEWSK